MSAGGTRYDFVHDLVREAAYRRLSGPRKRLVHLQIARAIHEQEQHGALASDVAHHATLGGDAELAVPAYVRAAERSLRVFANDEAARLAQTGIQHAAALPRELRAGALIDLYRVYVHSGKWLARATEVETELTKLLHEAQLSGLDDEKIAGGYFLLGAIARERGGLDLAHASSLRAAEVVRGADAAAKVKQLADTARCLVLIERDMDRAVAMLAEAEALAASASVTNVIDLDWGAGLVDAYTGRLASARARLETALGAARATEQHWVVCETLNALAELALEHGEPSDALARTAELAPVVAKMGEGTEGSAMAALDALARRALGEEGAIARVDAALAELRRVDAKGYLAYALNVAAEHDLADGDVATARVRASEALGAASTMKRASQVAIARAILARSGARADAAAELAAVAADMSRPYALSARARAAVEAARAALAPHDSNDG